MACYNNDLTTTSVLLRAGAYPNSCNKFGQTPLLLAVRKYNVAMVKELIGAGVDVNKMEQEGLSALMMCCDDGNSEMAKLLLDYQANPDLQQSETGYTALMFACKGGHLDTVIGLMEHGADAKIRNVAPTEPSQVPWSLLNMLLHNQPDWTSSSWRTLFLSTLQDH
ncbi:Putative ankyrin repeat protein L93 [Geodia barretti]|uniref:Ankyrin repeat protein L93 n=1 Tax=Geodia barretti TaxID=519541 RepID=A0AA35X1B6_GEOBA|nr:Putative ankyrin repeat protein L93 [Geodia barretti]